MQNNFVRNSEISKIYRQSIPFECTYSLLKTLLCTLGEDLLEACAEALAAKKSCSNQQHTQAVSRCGHLIESEIHRHGPPIHDIVDERTQRQY
jgi:hypothetical protein